MWENTVAIGLIVAAALLLALRLARRAGGKGGCGCCGSRSTCKPEDDDACAPEAGDRKESAERPTK